VAKGKGNEITSATMAGLDLRVVDATGAGSAAAGESPPPVVILLHGFSMRADDLAPFGASLGLSALFLFPEGPVDLRPLGLPGRAWWEIDVARRDADVAQGRQRDLGQEAPAGLPAANRALAALVDEVLVRWPGRPLFLGGFSQGAILSLDLTLRRRPPLAGLILLSSGRVTNDSWVPLMKNVESLPMFQSHGRQDRELSFSAAGALAADLAAAGARHTFLPFDGGHEIPLPVLRALKKFLRTSTGQGGAGTATPEANERGR
jgi:phospholipase/carboxylesterase